MKIIEMDPIPHGMDPMDYDLYNTSTRIGTNVLVMFPNAVTDKCPYLIVVNTETGERRKVIFEHTVGTTLGNLFEGIAKLAMSM